MNDVRFDLFLLISFAVVSVVLDVAGLLSYFEGFDQSLTGLILLFGVALTIITIILAQDFGYINLEWGPLS